MHENLTAALLDLEADLLAERAHLETTLDLGPFGPSRDAFDEAVLAGFDVDRDEADAQRAAHDAELARTADWPF